MYSTFWFRFHFMIVWFRFNFQILYTVCPCLYLSSDSFVFFHFICDFEKKAHLCFGFKIEFNKKREQSDLAVLVYCVRLRKKHFLTSIQFQIELLKIGKTIRIFKWINFIIKKPFSQLIMWKCLLTMNLVGATSNFFSFIFHISIQINPDRL